MYGYSGKPDDTLTLVRSKRKKTRPEQHSIEIGRIWDIVFRMRQKQLTYLYGEVAQLVERGPEEPGVGGSSPSLPTMSKEGS